MLVTRLVLSNLEFLIKPNQSGMVARDSWGDVWEDVAQLSVNAQTKVIYIMFFLLLIDN